MEPGDGPIPPSLPQGGNNYTLSLGLRIPLFAGFSRIYDQRQAAALADAAAARAEPWASRWSSRCSARTTPCGLLTGGCVPAEDLMASARALERGGPGPIQGRGGIRAGSPVGAKRAGRRPRPAGAWPGWNGTPRWRSSPMMQEFSTTGAEARSVSSRTPPPRRLHDENTVSSSASRSSLGNAGFPSPARRMLQGESPADAAGSGKGGRRRAAADAVRAGRHRHG